jgi:DNA-binding response OmpR family regulator/DNA-binding CsgD family transcriptional regulator
MFQLLENKIILVVDDDPQNRETVINSMFALSPETIVISAVNGEQALKLIEKRRPDLVLLDWEMPVLNGYETLVKIKENENTADIAVVMYTGIMTDIESLQRALLAGASDFLRKPTDPIEILSRIRSILNQKELWRLSIIAEQKKNEAQLQEMLSVSLQLQQNETLLEKIKDEIKLAYHATNPFEYIEKIIKELKQIDLNETDWERYKIRLDAGQNGFIEKLSIKHPELTRQQLTICSLLRLGLVSKEAAKILNMSMDAFDKSRYRIRKKLNISQELFLENYLMQF